MIDDEGLRPELAMYLKRIGDMRDINKHGRAVQLCDKALAHEPQPPILNVILNFKGDSLYRVGRKTRDETLVQEARKYFIESLEIDPHDHNAKKGLEAIDFLR
jgi:hypothetical protein